MEPLNITINFLCSNKYILTAIMKEIMKYLEYHGLRRIIDSYLKESKTQKNLSFNAKSVQKC